MEAQRTVTILLPDDAALRATLDAFCVVQIVVSAAAFNGGKPLRAVELQRAVYEQAKGRLSSLMTITETGARSPAPLGRGGMRRR
jgi:hypothetical protein